MPIQHTTYATPREDLGIAFHEFDVMGNNLVAEQVLPEIPVMKKAATLSVITRENMKLADTQHTNGSAFARVNLISEDMSYQCTDNGLEIPVTDEDRENYASDYDAEVESVQVVKTIMKLRREVRVAAAIFNTSTWTGADLYTDNSGSPWDAAGTDVIGQVDDAKEKVRKNTGYVPDSMVIGAKTFKNLRSNTAILSKFVAVPILTMDLLMKSIATILGIENLIVGGAVYDSAKEGQSFSSTDVWSDDYALIFKKQMGATKANPGLGRICTWSGESGQLANGLENVVQYREEQTESDIFRVRDFSTEKIFDPYFAHLLKIDVV